jgi:hypothetical protein
MWPSLALTRPNANRGVIPYDKAKVGVRLEKIEKLAEF